MNTKTVSKIIQKSFKNWNKQSIQNCAMGVFVFLQSVAFISEDDILQADVNSAPTTYSQRILTSIKSEKNVANKSLWSAQRGPSTNRRVLCFFFFFFWATRARAAYLQAEVFDVIYVAEQIVKVWGADYWHRFSAKKKTKKKTQQGLIIVNLVRDPSAQTKYYSHGFQKLKLYLANCY